MADPGISIAGVARIDQPEPVWIARSKTSAARLSMCCADPIGRSRIAVYIGGENRKWFMPAGAAYCFFEDGLVIYPRGLHAGKQSSFVLGSEFYDGFPEHCGVMPTEFSIYQHGYDPELERKCGRELPLHFHWIEMNDDLTVPAAVHCSTEAYHPTTTIVRINRYLVDPKQVIPRADWRQFALDR